MTFISSITQLLTSFPPACSIGDYHVISACNLPKAGTAGAHLFFSAPVVYFYRRRTEKMIRPGRRTPLPNPSFSRLLPLIPLYLLLQGSPTPRTLASSWLGWPRGALPRLVGETVDHIRGAAQPWPPGPGPHARGPRRRRSSRSRRPRGAVEAS